MPADGRFSTEPAESRVHAEPAESRFRAMGTDVHIVVAGAPHLLSRARRRIEDLEQRWSRFLPDSEISMLNRSEGHLTVLSQETFDVVRLALVARSETGGLFDPTVLGDLVAAGYDRSFDLLHAGQLAPPLRVTTQLAGDQRIACFPSVNAVVLPTGVGIDLGGIGKGRAADLVANELLAAGAHGACVNIGGDLRVVGHFFETSDGPPLDWTIGIEDPVDGHEVSRVVLADGAVATTSRLKRAWYADGEVRHHVIDPRTGHPAQGGVATLSVIAAQGWQAEVLAKAAFVAGVDACFESVEASGAAALAILDDGTVVRSTRMADFMSVGVGQP